MIKAQFNHFTDDDRIFTDIILKFNSTFLFVYLFTDEKRCSFSTLFKFNNITVNNNNL